MSTRVWIHGGRVVDPSQGLDGPADVILEDGRIAAIGPGLQAPEDAESIDASGLVVAPGLIGSGGCSGRIHYCLDNAEHQSSDRQSGRRRICEGSGGIGRWRARHADRSGNDWPAGQADDGNR